MAALDRPQGEVDVAGDRPALHAAQAEVAAGDLEGVAEGPLGHAFGRRPRQVGLAGQGDVAAGQLAFELAEVDVAGREEHGAAQAAQAFVDAGHRHVDAQEVGPAAEAEGRRRCRRGCLRGPAGRAAAASCRAPGLASSGTSHSAPSLAATSTGDAALGVVAAFEAQEAVAALLFEGEAGELPGAALASCSCEPGLADRACGRPPPAGSGPARWSARAPPAGRARRPGRPARRPPCRSDRGRAAGPAGRGRRPPPRPPRRRCRRWCRAGRRRWSR